MTNERRSQKANTQWDSQQFGAKRVLRRIKSESF
jgi:hypothetical protein